LSKRQIPNRLKLEIEQLNKNNQLKSQYNYSSGINVTIEPCNYIHQNNNKKTETKVEVTQNISTDAIAIVDESFDSEHEVSPNVHSSEFSNSTSSFHEISVDTSMNEFSKTKLEINHIIPYHEDIFRETLACVSQTNENFEINVVNNISRWKVEENISRTSFTKLLKILRTYQSLDFLPKDSRTVLHTPKFTMIRNVNPGHYWHRGIKLGVQQFLKRNAPFTEPTIELVINVDGLPISNSSQSQLWPILGSVLGYNDVFIIGIYHGDTKPADSMEYLKDFVVEAKLLVENGITFETMHYACIISTISADSPAKAFLLNIKGHSGYGSCTKCTTHGEYKENRVCFPLKSGIKRLDSDYETKLDNDFHMGRSALEDILKLGLVTNVPMDYLHLICIGICKKLLNLWCNDKVTVRLPFRKNKLYPNH